MIVETATNKYNIVIKFAGDSGDGMQLTGTEFTNNAALFGNDIATFPDFPAEIRAPQGTIPGVSGFQLHFGSDEIDSPGDSCDVLVAMNAAALKTNLRHLKKGGLIIADTAGFESKNLKLAGYAPDANPIENDSLSAYQLQKIDVTKLTKEALNDSGLDGKSIDRCKNMFVLGYVYWLFHRDLKSTIDFLRTRFAKKELLRDANIKVLQTGYNYGETVESAVSLRVAVAPAKMKEGVYRNIMGNQATALGLIAASVKSNLKLFYGSYPITPASDILHELAKHKNFGVITFQAEDEIAAAASAIGASYGGNLGVTGTSGPGLALKSESISLAVSLELPLVVVNVQRAGPSTGMPTKTEQADLLFAMYGRHGESPLPIVAAKSPADCFDAIFEACRIALKHMTPVIFLSDGYIANGAEPWRFPAEEDLEDLHVNFVAANTEGFQPYKRNELLVRNWAIPGTVGAEHRIGGLEKQDITGNISYDPANHEHMVHTRAKKVALIADSIPELQVELGQPSGDVLVLGWGSPYGSIRAAVKELIAEGHSVAHAHLRHINPFPKNLAALMKQFKTVVIPEINSGQLANMIRAQYLNEVVSLTKVQGLPFSKSDIVEKIKEVLP